MIANHGPIVYRRNGRSVGPALVIGLFGSTLFFTQIRDATSAGRDFI